MKKDILFLCQFFYPEHNSSATLPFDTAKYLAAQGYTVDALVGYPKEYINEQNVPIHENVNGIDIRRLHYIQMKRGKRISRLINYLSFTLSAGLRLFRLSQYKSVIVYSNPPILPLIPVLANLLFKTKIVFIAYDVYPEIAYASNSICKGSTIDRGMRWLNHLLYKRADQIVALTEEMRDFLLKNRPELAPDKITVIPNWAHEATTFPTPEVYERFGFRPDQFIVSYFGNMGICQEMETLAEAAERLKDNDKIRFLFIGHGSKQPLLKERFAEKGMTNTRMYDFLTGEAFEQAVAISSCCVVTLEKGIKGMGAPSKYYSYLQGGKPIISVVEDGSYLEEEINTYKIGRTVSMGNSEELMNCLLQMASRPEDVSLMGKRAAELYLQRYEYAHAMKQYDRLVCRNLAASAQNALAE